MNKRVKICIRRMHIQKLFKVKIVREKITYHLKFSKNELKISKPCLKSSASKLVEYTKAFEKSIIKELGKLTHVTSG